MQVLAVIPARGGSKGLPRKNLLPIGGIPLVARTICAAEKSSLLGRVVVSTDDGEIAGVARRYGAEVVDRPAAISGDEASSESALFHALDALESNESYRPDILALLQCTAPFLDAADIDGTVDMVGQAGWDSAFAAVPFHHFVWSPSGDGQARGANHPGGPRRRRQDLDPQYLEAGSVYAMRVSSFRQAGHRFCGRTGIYVSDPRRAFEIDSAFDLAVAQALAPLVATQNPAALPDRIACVAFDFDGVMTDNRVFVSESGEESVACDRGDGLGVSALRELGIPMLVLSKERNPVVAARCRKLHLECLQGIDDKSAALSRWLAERDFEPRHLVYVGNDVNDAECFRMAGYAVGPSDSHPEVWSLLDLKLQARGGRGAVRELSDLIVAGLRSGAVSIVPGRAAAGPT